MTLAFLVIISLVIVDVVKSKTVEDLGVSDVEKLCVADKCKDLTKDEYKILKSFYKEKINKKEPLTYDEYKELIAIINKEAKIMPIKLNKYNKGNMVQEIIERALK